MTEETDALVEHKTSSGLQIISVKGDGDVTRVLVDSRTRHTLPMDETQWRELEMYVVTHVGLAQTEGAAPKDSPM